jgi:homoserine O-acetyltransferase
MSTPDYSIFDAGDVVLQSGRTFPSMRIAYKTYGTLAPDRDNVIVYPTSFAAQHVDTEWLIRPDGILDPSRYFIIVPNLSLRRHCLSAIFQAARSLCRGG